MHVFMHSLLRTRCRFNPGSQLTIADATSTAIVARTAVTTTLAGSAAGVVMLLWKRVWAKEWDALAVCNGVLAGEHVRRASTCTHIHGSMRASCMHTVCM